MKQVSDRLLHNHERPMETFPFRSRASLRLHVSTVLHIVPSLKHSVNPMDLALWLYDIILCRSICGMHGQVFAVGRLIQRFDSIQCKLDVESTWSTAPV